MDTGIGLSPGKHKIEDEWKVKIIFTPVESGTRLGKTSEGEDTHMLEMQQAVPKTGKTGHDPLTDGFAYKDPIAASQRDNSANFIIEVSLRN